MNKELGFDPVVLLLLFGVYFVLDYYTSKFIPELLYGFSLIFYYFKCIIIRKKYRAKNDINNKI